MRGPVTFFNVLLTVCSDAAYASLVGCLFGKRWVAGDLASSLRVFSQWCALVLLLTHLIRPWFLGASMSGSNGFAENLALMPEIISSTHQGTLWLIDSAAIAVLLFVNFFRRAWPRTATWFSITSLVILAGAKAASGHASNGGDFTLAEFSMLLHFLAIAIWAGAIVVSGLVIIPRLAGIANIDALWTYGKSLSRTVTWALVVVVCSGIYTSDHELDGAWIGLWHSGWGRVLLAKMCFVSVALSLGALTRFRCLRCPPTKQTAMLIVGLVRAEAVVMLLILSLSGVLANMQPPMRDI